MNIGIKTAVKLHIVSEGVKRIPKWRQRANSEYATKKKYLIGFWARKYCIKLKGKECLSHKQHRKAKNSFKFSGIKKSRMNYGAFKGIATSGNRWTRVISVAQEPLWVKVWHKKAKKNVGVKPDFKCINANVFQHLEHCLVGGGETQWGSGVQGESTLNQRHWLASPSPLISIATRRYFARLKTDSSISFAWCPPSPSPLILPTRTKFLEIYSQHRKCNCFTKKMYNFPTTVKGFGVQAKISPHGRIFLHRCRLWQISGMLKNFVSS